MEFRRHARSALGLLERCADACSAALALHLAWSISAFARSPRPADYPHPSFALTIIFVALVSMLLDHAGAYRPARGLMHVRETAALMSACIKSGIVLLAAHLAGWLQMPVVELPLTLQILFLVVLLEKTAVHALQDKLHAEGITSTPIALCGQGLCCRRLFTALVNSPRAGLWPRAVVIPPTDGPVVESNYARLRSAEIVMPQLDLRALQEARVEKVLFIAGALADQELQQKIAEVRAWGLEAEICAGDCTTATSPVEWADMDGLMLCRKASEPSLFYCIAKRTFDIACSAMLLILFTPLMALIAAVIKATSPGTVLFRQQRVGKDGVLFTMLKFRSMHQHACGDAYSPKDGADPRTSRVGRILRKTSLDELPQLFNVLRGDMSLVGPRPEMPFIAEQYTALESRRLEVKPGITGLWQISAHRKDLIHNNMQYDLYYLRNRGCFLDLAILMHTAVYAMRGV